MKARGAGALGDIGPHIWIDLLIGRREEATGKGRRVYSIGLLFPGGAILLAGHIKTKKEACKVRTKYRKALSYVGYFDLIKPMEEIARLIHSEVTG